MSAAGKHSPGDGAIEGGEKGKRAFFERKNSVAAAKFDAVAGRNVVDGRRINTKRVDRII